MTTPPPHEAAGKFPPRLFLRRVDVGDIVLCGEWSEGYVHTLYSPKTLFSTHMDKYLSEQEHEALLTAAVAAARADSLRYALHLIEQHGIPDGIQAIRAHAAKAQEARNGS